MLVTIADIQKETLSRMIVLGSIASASQETVGLMMDDRFILCQKCTLPHLLCWFPYLLGTCLCESDINLPHPFNPSIVLKGGLSSVVLELLH